MERAKHGLHPLQWVDELQAIARDHSRDMAKNSYFDHDNQQGEGPTDRGNKAGYPCLKGNSYGLGENIYFGGGPQAAMTSWMTSPGHRQNILDAGYDRLGVGVHEGRLPGYGRGFFTTAVFC